MDYLNNEENCGENFDQSLIVHHWKATSSYRNSKIYRNVDDAVKNWLPLGKLKDAAVLVSITSDK